MLYICNFIVLTKIMPFFITFTCTYNLMCINSQLKYGRSSAVLYQIATTELSC